MLNRLTKTELPIGRLSRWLVGDLITVVWFAAIAIGLARLDLEAARGPKFYMTQLNYQTSQELYAAMGRPDDAALMAAKIVH